MNSLRGRRVLIVSLYYSPEETGIAPYTTGLAEHLASSGASVTVLAGIPHYPKWKVFEGYERKRRVAERINGVRVKRIRTFIPTSQSALSRALYEASFLAHVFTLVTCRAPDAIVGVVPSLSGGFLSAAAAKAFRCPMALLVQDLTGPAARQSGIRGGSDRVAAITTCLEGWMLRRAQRVAIVAQGFRPYVESQGVPDRLIEELPNWSRLDSPTKSVAETRELRGWQESEQIVLHAGNMGLKQGLEAIVDAARLALDISPHVRFVLLGEGNQRGLLEALSADLPNLSILDPLPMHEFSNALNAADVLLVNERNTVTDMSLPSKITTYYQAGRPVLAATHPRGATAALIRESGGGVVVPAGDAPALLGALEELRKDSDLANRLRTSALAYAEAHFSESSILQKLAEFVSSLMSPKG